MRYSNSRNLLLSAMIITNLLTTATTVLLIFPHLLSIEPTKEDSKINEGGLLSYYKIALYHIGTSALGTLLKNILLWQLLHSNSYLHAELPSKAKFNRAKYYNQDIALMLIAETIATASSGIFLTLNLSKMLESITIGAAFTALPGLFNLNWIKTITPPKNETKAALAEDINRLENSGDVDLSSYRLLGQ